MTDTPIELDDLIVLLLGSPATSPALQDRLDGVTRLEKLVFLLDHESSLSDILDEDPEFHSHNFGPFSSKVYKAVDTLVAAGILTDSAALSDTSEDAWEADRLIGTVDDPYATRNFALTDRGKRYYSALESEVDQKYIKELVQFKSQFGTLPLRRLVRYVYQRYPAFTDKSVIRDDILGT